MVLLRYRYNEIISESEIKSCTLLCRFVAVARYAQHEVMFLRLDYYNSLIARLQCFTAAATINATRTNVLCDTSCAKFLFFDWWKSTRLSPHSLWDFDKVISQCVTLVVQQENNVAVLYHLYTITNTRNLQVLLAWSTVTFGPRSFAVNTFKFWNNLLPPPRDSTWTYE